MCLFGGVYVGVYGGTDDVYASLILMCMLVVDVTYAVLIDYIDYVVMCVELSIGCVSHVVGIVVVKHVVGMIDCYIVIVADDVVCCCCDVCCWMVAVLDVIDVHVVGIVVDVCVEVDNCEVVVCINDCIVMYDVSVNAMCDELYYV